MAGDAPRSERIVVRLRPGEREAIEKLASESGATLSEYVRAAVAEPHERRIDSVTVALFGWEFDLIERAAEQADFSVAEWLRDAGCERAELLLQREEEDRGHT